jgi:hypothetical protein
MANEMTLQELTERVKQLSHPEQLSLVAEITQYLSRQIPAVPEVTQAVGLVDEETLQKQHEKKVDELLALADAAARQWNGEFDSAEEIRRMRQARDEQIWPSK